MHPSTIEWTEATWNPIRGCVKVSPGCKHCYAEAFAERFRGVPGHPYEQGFDVRLVPHKLSDPLRWTRPTTIFVNSMSDLFHTDVPREFVRRVFDVMVRCPQHTFQVLTKRSRRAHEESSDLPWPENVWMGVSVEDQHVTHRITDLQSVPAAVRFLSCEPLLGPLDDLPLEGIHWVIVGGESGPHARPMKTEWVEGILKQCQEAHVAFFFKQWGGVRKHVTGRLLHGRYYDEMPPTKRGLFTAR